MMLLSFSFIVFFPNASLERRSQSAVRMPNPTTNPKTLNMPQDQRFGTSPKRI
jgi:hypothetical protein